MSTRVHAVAFLHTIRGFVCLARSRPDRRQCSPVLGLLTPLNGFWSPFLPPTRSIPEKGQDGASGRVVYGRGTRFPSAMLRAPARGITAHSGRGARRVCANAPPGVANRAFEPGCSSSVRKPPPACLSAHSSRRARRVCGKPALAYPTARRTSEPCQGEAKPVDGESWPSGQSARQTLATATSRLGLIRMTTRASTARAALRDAPGPCTYFSVIRRVQVPSASGNSSASPTART